MKVTLVTAHYPPRLSGHGDFCMHLASSLHTEGLDVSVVVLGQDLVIDSDGLDVRTAPFPGTRRDLTAALDAVEATNPDVICLQFEAHAFRSKWLPRLLPLALRRRGHRVIMTYHELRKPGRLGQVPKAVLLNSAHRVVAFSKWHAEGIGRFRHIGQPADIVACGPSIVRAITADRRLLRARFAIPDDMILFTFFGFVMVQHKLAELLESLTAVRSNGVDARLQVIGRFDPIVDGYHQQLADLVSDLGLTEAVTWHGRVMSDDDVARLLQISDVGVLPYDTGVGENNSSLAALAHYGVPTVTTRGERSAEMETMEVAYFVEPTLAGLTVAMLDLGRDRARRDLLSKRVREWSDRRSWAKVGSAYASLLTGDPDYIEVM